MECWRCFILACRLLSQHHLSRDNVILADTILLKFYRRTEYLYGASVVTPAMDFHHHLKSCILDLGQPYVFWCFPFERYNGLLGKVQNNNKSIEVQMMNNFINGYTFMSSPLLDTFVTKLWQHKLQDRKLVGLVLEDNDLHNFAINHVVVCKCFTRYQFASEDIEELKLYWKLYLDEDIEVYSSLKSTIPSMCMVSN